MRRRVTHPQAYQTHTTRRVKVIRREGCGMGTWFRVDIGLSAPKPEFRKCDKWKAGRKETDGEKRKKLLIPLSAFKE